MHQTPCSSISDAGFQIDALTSRSDWPDFNILRFDWLRAPSSEHQIENPSEGKVFPEDLSEKLPKVIGIENSLKTAGFIFEFHADLH